MNKDTTVEPNLFIVGAPRSGTTAMRRYLSQHSDITFSAVREPNFFDTDFSDDLRKFTNKEEYLEECFGDIEAPPEYVAEKTVWYLYSKEAIKNIYESNPDAKFIVMLRNPVELVYSLHRKLFEIQQETASDFKKAWELQEKRREGEAVPESCPDRKVLLYGEVGKLGTQLERLFETVPESQVHPIVFDDFADGTQEVHADVLDFLGLEAEDEADFTRVNGSRAVRSSNLQYFLRQGSQKLYRPFSGVSEFIKRQLGIKRWNIMQKLSQLNVRRESRKQLSPELREELADHFREDVQKLSDTLDRDLTDWTKV